MPFQQMPMNFRADRTLPGTHALRIFAAAICVLAAVEAVAMRQPLVALAGLLLGIGVALTAHLFVERRSSGRLFDLPPPDTWQGNAARWLLMALCFLGLGVTLLDLGDLTEKDEVLIYPIAQLGLPVMAFLAAVTVGALALMSAPVTAARTRQEQSFWHAALALILCGAAAFALAELTEHGVPDIQAFDILIASIVSVALIALLYRRGRAVPVSATRHVLPVAPHTLGIRVDGRARWVDFLEDCMSFGQRRNILAATLSASGIAPGGNLLDIGCGTGELVVAAATIIGDGGRMRDGYALGVDATPAMIALAQDRAEQAGVLARFEVAVAENLPLTDAVMDAVASSFFFHHLPSAVKAEALREMWRVLRPGGRLIITDYGRPQNPLGLIASFPMRFNFHEYVRGQLNGEIEAVIAQSDIGRPRIARSFLGYINVLVLEKPAA